MVEARLVSHQKISDLIWNVDGNKSHKMHELQSIVRELHSTMSSAMKCM